MHKRKTHAFEETAKAVLSLLSRFKELFIFPVQFEFSSCDCLRYNLSLAHAAINSKVV